MTQLRDYLAENSVENASIPFVYAGNLYAEPLLDDVLAQIAADGRQNIRVLITHAFGTPTGCLRYRRALAEAVERLERQWMLAEKPAQNWRFSFVEPFFDSPRFYRAVADTLLNAGAQLRLEQGFTARSGENRSSEESVFVLFSAHALPADESAKSGYEAQLLSVCEKVAAASGLRERWSPGFAPESDVILPTHSLKHSIPRLPAGNGGLVDRTTEKLKWNRYTQTTTQKTAQTTAFDDSWRWNLVYQSRSGRPAQPWSEPSIGDFLRQIRGVFPEIRNILVVPIGFFFENMETVGDLDKDFAEICAENGVRYWRAEAVGNTFQAVCLAANLLTEGPNDAFCADFNDSKEEFGRIGACSTCELRCKSEKK